jgi:hypothetical protein
VCYAFDHFARLAIRSGALAGLGSRVSREAIRDCMVDHLLERRDLHARSQAEIVALLGEPTQTDYFEELGLDYWLALERGSISIVSRG